MGTGVLFQAVTTCRNAGCMSGDGAKWTGDMTGSMPVLDHSISLLRPRQGGPSQELPGSRSPPAWPSPCPNGFSRSAGNEFRAQNRDRDGEPSQGQGLSK